MGISVWFHKFIGYFCKTKSKSIKKTAKILGFSLAGIVLFFALLYILLQNSKIQNYVAQSVVTELATKLHTKVSVGKVNYKLFNVFSVNDLYVQDLQQDTLIFVHQADAHFNFWKFFSGKIIFTSIDIDQLHGNLKVDKSGNSNLDFVINAFKHAQTTDTTQVEYHIKHFKLHNSTFTYHNLKLLKNSPKGVFNGNNLKFNNINADIALDIFKKDSLNAQILELSATEQTGLVISNFRTQVVASKTAILIPSIELKLPNSNIKLDDIKLKYDSLADLKKLVEKVRWNAPISQSTITLSDLKAFIPEFKNARGVATVKGLISGRISSIRFQKMEIKYGKSISLKADLDINGLPNLNEAFIYGQINELNVQPTEVQDFLSQISGKPVILPKELNQLGLVKYKGNVTGFLSNLVAYGNLNTNLGSVSTDILLKLENELKDLSYNGTIKSANFQLGKLLNNNELGKVSFNFNTKGSKKEKSSLQGTITAKVPELQFKNYSYRDIQFDGKYDGKGFDGKVDVEDDNIHAHFIGIIDLTQKLPVFDFDLKVQNTNLNALHLTNKYQGATLSFNGKTNMVGNALDNINGYIRFDSISFTNQGKKLNVDKIQVISRIDKYLTLVDISSDYVNGSLSGNFKYSTINQTINKIVQNYLPSLSIGANDKGRNTNHIDVDLQIANTKEISDVLVLPYSLEGTTTLKGYIDEETNKIDISGNIPVLKTSKQFLENIYLHCDNPKQQLQLTSRALLHEKDGLLNIFATGTASKDSVRAQLGWQNSQKVTNAGEFKAVAGFRKENGRTAAKISVLPTQIIISDSVWDIHRCTVDFNADSTIQVHNFVFDNHKQFVHVNGIASGSQQEGMVITMNDISLDFIFNLIKLKSISIGGNVTGKATLFSLLKQPIYEANLSVKNVTLNQKPIGDANIFSTWDKENSQVRANAIFVNDKKETVATVDGVFVPKTDSLDFIFDAHKLSIEFLDRYFESVVQNFKGYASGKIRMFGPSKILGFEADALITGGQASVKMLKTTYFFNDSVHLTRKTISLKNIKVYDQERNQGTLTGMIKHNGLFQQLHYDVNIAGQNILALNTHAEDNDYFFGKAYANGSAHIFGDEKVANIWVNAFSQPKTKCFINMGGASTASNNNFINFVNKKINTRKELVTLKPTPSSINVKVNLQIDVTPDAEMELIVDPKGGDVITGRGNGNLRVEFDTFSDIKLYGTYTINNNGYYLFTLQNLIRKEFKIDNGSTLAWTGNPYNAQVNIRALYPLSASLKDLLDQSITQNQNQTRSTVPVNCVLKLTDNLRKPTISFDIELPQSDESMKQQVRNIINTEEMMNHQILYLLVFNKFYTPEYLQNTTNATTNSIVPNEAISFGLSTLSAQVNSWISKASNNFTVGFDYRASDKVSNESQFSTQLLYQPNSRLIINGNFGYSNENANASTNTNKFIGDIDVEYLLTESGKIRLKAYNHTVDRYRLITARTTQGVGLLYKEDFNSPGDMINYYWKILTNIGKKKTTNETATKQNTDN
jgi:hypothetical protein